jgi:diguanylate cyclase (GGDEF)-like protein
MSTARPRNQVDQPDNALVDALEHVAQMTRERDRVLIDATLVSSLLDLLPVERVSQWQLVTEEGERRWLAGPSQSRGQLVATTDQLDPHWAELTQFEDLPLHARAVVEQMAVRSVMTDAAGQPQHLLVMALPLGQGSEGVIELGSARPLDETHERMVQGVLRIVHNFRSLLDYSERDTLTGLLNRKSFDETFMRATVLEATREFGSAEDRRRGLSQKHWLGVADIDHFKHVNDQYGHLIGDEVLVLMARILRSTFRYHDRTYRFGGEEFVVLLTAPDDAAAGGAFERLRRNLAEFEFPRVGRVTASIGYSDVRPGDTPQAAFDRADRATYYAKQNGRNQVRSHAELVGLGLLDSGPGVGEIELF